MNPWIVLGLCIMSAMAGALAIGIWALSIVKDAGGLAREAMAMFNALEARLPPGKASCDAVCATKGCTFRADGSTRCSPAVCDFFTPMRAPTVYPETGE